MRDYQADVVHAALCGQPLPAADFSWSPARAALFAYCKRAYFIRYYLALGGWNIHAHPIARTAYLEKHLPTLKQFLAGTLEHAIADAIAYTVQRNSDSGQLNIFRQALIRRLEQAVTALVIHLDRGDYRNDPKLPGLLETFHGESGFTHPGKIGSRIAGIFGNVLPGLLADNWTQDIILANPLELKMKEKILQLPWRGFSVWLHAGIIRLQGNTASTIRFSADPEENARDLSLDAAIFRDYARTKWRKEQAVFHLFRFPEDEETGWSTVEPGPETDTRIDVSSLGMIRMIRDNGTVRMDDFECAADREQCLTCSYRKTCELINNNSK